MKLHYFYTLKAMWDGQGKIKMYYGMPMVKKQLLQKRSIMKKKDSPFNSPQNKQPNNYQVFCSSQTIFKRKSASKHVGENPFSSHLQDIDSLSLKNNRLK